jgi:hypothetical protein
LIYSDEDKKTLTSSGEYGNAPSDSIREVGRVLEKLSDYFVSYEGMGVLQHRILVQLTYVKLLD